MKKLLEEDITVVASKKEGEPLRAYYTKKESNGLCYYELPEEEAIVLNMLPTLIMQLEQNKILQIHQEADFVVGYIGEVKTEGGECSNKYLDVITEVKTTEYDSLLLELELKLKQIPTTEITSYKKLYKGDKRYE